MLQTLPHWYFNVNLVTVRTRLPLIQMHRQQERTKAALSFLQTSPFRSLCHLLFYRIIEDVHFFDVQYIFYFILDLRNASVTRGILTFALFSLHLLSDQNHNLCSWLAGALIVSLLSLLTCRTFQQDTWKQEVGSGFIWLCVKTSYDDIFFHFSFFQTPQRDDLNSPRPWHLTRPLIFKLKNGSDFHRLSPFFSSFSCSSSSSSFFVTKEKDFSIV